MAIEYELKYRATEEILQDMEQLLPGDGQVFQMHTTYYDTPTGQLSARWYTLRKRLENGTAVCTLKAPAGDRGRGEWEINCDSIEDAVPALCKLGCPGDLEDLVKEGLLPVCGAKFTRIAKTVVLPECTVEVALDKGILYGGDKELALCEAEVELKSGSPEACAAYAGKLAALFRLQPEAKSKFRRARMLYLGE